MARKALDAYLQSSALVGVVVTKTGSSRLSGRGMPDGGVKVCSRIAS